MNESLPKTFLSTLFSNTLSLYFSLLVRGPRFKKHLATDEIVIPYNFILYEGRRSSVGTATELRAGWSGERIPVGERFAAPVQRGPGANPGS